MKNISHSIWIIFLLALGACQTGTPAGSPTATRTSASVGDWKSGGGYAPNNQFNPWFLQNTATVKYCFLVDQNNFGLDLESAKSAFREALQFWITEFQISRRAYNIKTTIAHLATQEFKETACEADTDLQIQLGFLTSQQLTRIETPKNYLALTVRTDYDPVQLRGKGFMYFSPVRGEQAPDFRPLGDDLWKAQRSIHFKIMAAHELGHVFGVTNSSLMSSGIMDYLRYMQYPQIRELYEHRNLSYFNQAELFPVEIRDRCTDGISDELPYVGKIACLRLRMKWDGTNYSNPTYELHYTLDRKKWIPYARLEVSGGSGSTGVFGNVRFDQRQKVFTVDPGQTSVETELKRETKIVDGKWIFADPKRKPMFSRLTFEGMTHVSVLVFDWKQSKEYSDLDNLLSFHIEHSVYRGPEEGAPVY